MQLFQGLLKMFCGLQFRPEVTHSEQGTEILRSLA